MVEVVLVTLLLVEFIEFFQAEVLVVVLQVGHALVLVDFPLLSLVLLKILVLSNHGAVLHRHAVVLLDLSLGS